VRRGCSPERLKRRGRRRERGGGDGGERDREEGERETGAEPTICRESQERNTSRSARNEISQRILIQERRAHPSLPRRPPPPPPKGEGERERERESAGERTCEYARYRLSERGREIFRDGIAFSGYAAPVFLDIRCRVTHSRRNIDRYLIVKYCSSRCAVGSSRAISERRESRRYVPIRS